MTKKIDIWSNNQNISPLKSDPAIAMTHFADYHEYHPELIKKMRELERDRSFVDRLPRGSCGTKVRHIDKWNSAAATLIHERAKEFFRQVLKTDKAVVDDCWGNIYYKDDYCIPHSHIRALAGVVYFLDAGDEAEEGDTLSGRFFIADPRVHYCNQHHPGHMTRVLLPNLQPGSMIIFPGYVVHGVNPYFGKKPRLTLSWNINQQKIAGSAEETFKNKKI